MDRLESHRQWYARLITAAPGAQAHDRLRSLRMAATGASPDGTCWLDGRGRWLSTSEAE